MIADILPVPVLVSPTEAHGMGHKLESEARESTPANSCIARKTDSRGGQKIKQDAAYYRSYRARNKGRIQKQEEKRRERDRNKKWVVQTTTGLPDVGWKILSEFQVDVAMRAFWGKRGMAVPSATMGGILPSVADFNEEVTIMGVRTGESFYGVRTN